MKTRYWIIGLAVLVSLCLVALSHFIPIIDSTVQPYINLDGKLAESLLMLSHTGGIHAAPWFAAFILIGILALSQSSIKEKLINALIVGVAVAVFAGGGALFNEHAIKESLEIPRPNIKALSTDVGNGHLAESAASFYQRGDKTARTKQLTSILEQPIPQLPLSPKIKNHWLEETGYSFPSGHSYTVFFFACYFSLTAAFLVRTWWPFLLLTPWAVTVCYSRSLLLLHTPTDITTGALQGSTLALVTFLFTRKWLLKTND